MQLDEIKTQHISRIYKKKLLFKIKRLKRKYFKTVPFCDVQRWLVDETFENICTDINLRPVAVA